MRESFDNIYNSLFNDITQGKIKNGEKLPSVSNLSDKYGIGVSMMREVLRALQSQSIIRIEQGRGSFVIYEPGSNKLFVSKSEIRELLDLTRFRAMLEPSFARTAAVQAFQTEIDMIIESAEKMADLAKNNEKTKDEDLNFHMLIAKATHNAYSIKVYEELQEELAKARKHTNIPGMKEKAAHYHLMIAEAIKTRNSGQAEMYMRSHLESNEELVLEMWIAEN
ncbi:FadR/GntR family transcriptional regulator [Salinicoccus hispanicus]|uniref:FCD domain-containing protein n=1 Tax=Salinicoccus hispanicus TaxID=157225 RepID=A0A6N8U2U4_9STAP|nr:FCD domain-containing protein [Salinicoccus hispanicus]MXQ51326.1 FCD domain-containing protein [Salinicoccus hispanicus]